jgi:hypothetical protein
MKGINFVTNDQNQPVAVMIDLKKYGALWEDFYDAILVEQRKNEPTISLAKLKNKLKAKGKLK